MKAISPIIEYQDKIQDINIEKIERNKFNPRERFNEEEEDELIESILNKGILNPIIVYKRKSDGKYIILDGERRYRACKKLNIKTIPARVLVREPDVLESLSLMFHIHNVRQEWTEFAISLTVKRIVDELGKTVEELSINDIRDLGKITSLTEYKIRKYLKFLDYPDDVIKMFLTNEVNRKDKEGPDPDILLEMHKPIQDMKEVMPDIIDKFSIRGIINICIQKKEEEVIKTNKEFRLIAQSLTAVKKQEIDFKILHRNLNRFFSEVNYTPDRVYHETAETLYHYKNIKRSSESFLKELKSFELKNLDADKRREMVSILREIINTIKSSI